jgi:hypothetical protein
MTIQSALARCHALGVILTPGEGETLLVSPPGVLPDDLKALLKRHKTEVLRLLATSTQEAAARDQELILPLATESKPQTIQETAPPVAVKIWSPILDTTVWVVADDLPTAEWPHDEAMVYTCAEVKILARVGPDTLAWVHPVKELFGARVVDGRPGAVQRGNSPSMEEAP